MRPRVRRLLKRFRPPRPQRPAPVAIPPGQDTKGLPDYPKPKVTELVCKACEGAYVALPVTRNLEGGFLWMLTCECRDSKDRGRYIGRAPTIQSYWRWPGK